MTKTLTKSGVDPVEKESLSLKWGTLKSWHLHSKKAQMLLRKYYKIGVSMSAAMQKDTPEQKRIICELIDTIKAESIYLDWDGKSVSKEAAKKYVLEYEG